MIRLVKEIHQPFVLHLCCLFRFPLAYPPTRTSSFQLSDLRDKSAPFHPFPAGSCLSLPFHRSSKFRAAFSYVLSVKYFNALSSPRTPQSLSSFRSFAEFYVASLTSISRQIATMLLVILLLFYFYILFLLFNIFQSRKICFSIFTKIFLVYFSWFVFFLPK